MDNSLKKSFSSSEVKSVLSIIDHTNLKQGALKADIVKLCNEAVKYGFKAVCVHPSNVALCVKELACSQVSVCTVVGFPLGENLPKLKAIEAEMAVADGACEIDMVISNSMVKNGKLNEILSEINLVKNSCNGKILKVIIETCLLTDDEIVKVSEIIAKSNADFVKTSTGFCGAGATKDGVALIKKTVGNAKLIKAAGGVSNASDALDMIRLGANRIGTSRGVAIAQEMLLGNECKDTAGY